MCRRTDRAAGFQPDLLLRNPRLSCEGSTTYTSTTVYVNDTPHFMALSSKRDIVWPRIRPIARLQLQITFRAGFTCLRHAK